METERTLQPGEVFIRHYDVNQANASIVHFSNGDALVIDTDHQKYTDDLENEVKSVDGTTHIALTHLDGDHGSAVDDIATAADDASVYVPHEDRWTENEMEGSVAEKVDDLEEDYNDVTVSQMTSRGDTLRGAESSRESGVISAVRWPPVEDHVTNPVEPGDMNENSLVLHLKTSQGRSLMFPGDVGHKVERELVKRQLDRPLDEASAADIRGTLDSDVLVLGHHGSKNSTSTEFLAATDADVCIISAPFDSPHDHPHPETLQRLRDVNPETDIYWTAPHDDITQTISEAEIDTTAESSVANGEALSVADVAALRYAVVSENVEAEKAELLQNGASIQANQGTSDNTKLHLPDDAPQWAYESALVNGVAPEDAPERVLDSDGNEIELDSQLAHSARSVYEEEHETVEESLSEPVSFEEEVDAGIEAKEELPAESVEAEESENIGQMKDEGVEETASENVNPDWEPSGDPDPDSEPDPGPMNP